jgi:cytidylate kinase
VPEPDIGVDLRRAVIAVDGPSGAGKSTVSRRVATALGLRYLDTGAMYRAATWAVLQRHVPPSDLIAVADVVASITLDVGTDAEHPHVEVDGTDVTAAIRSAEVTASVSAVSAVPEVRRVLVAQQRDIVGAGGIVVEGRDIGTVVWPHAVAKFFLTADAGARAARRALELAAVQRSGGAGAATDTSDLPPDTAAVQADLERRDRFDSGRNASPLLQADDAVVIDATALDVDGVVAALLATVAAKVGATPDRFGSASTRPSGGGGGFA